MFHVRRSQTLPALRAATQDRCPAKVFQDWVGCVPEGAEAEVEAGSVQDACDLKAVMDKADADTLKKQESLQTTVAEAVNAKWHLLDQANFRADAARRPKKLSEEDAKRKSSLDAMVLGDLRNSGVLDPGTAWQSAS